MTILTEKFRFIRDDVFLCPRVDTETGRQQLFLQKINLNTEEIEFEDRIDCIHTAITNISPEEFENYKNNANAQESMNIKILEIRSSESLAEINLTPEEKFQALKSWAAGIAESGRDAFRIQNEIEKYGNLAIPISNFLIRFMVKVDSEFIEEYILKIERECVYEGVKYDPFIFMSLMPIFELLWTNYQDQDKFRESDIQTLKKIIINPTFRLKEEFLLKFPVYIKYKMESDKSFFIDCIERLEMKPFINENKFIESLIPFFDVMMEDYIENGEPDELLISILFSNLNIPDKIFRDNLDFILPIAHSNKGEDFLPYFMDDIKQDFETGKIDNEEYLKILRDLLDLVYNGEYSYAAWIPKEEEIILENVMEIEPPFTIFKNKPELIGLLTIWKPSFIPEFLKTINNEVTKDGTRDDKLFLKLIAPILIYTFYGRPPIPGGDEVLDYYTNDIRKAIFELNPPMEFYENSSLYPNPLTELIKSDYIEELSKQKILKNLFKNSKSRLMNLIEEMKNNIVTEDCAIEFNRIMNLKDYEPSPITNKMRKKKNKITASEHPKQRKIDDFFRK
jgi:hypothetical protein